jgi:3-oxoacyl-[acyl-carrier protein] reductase
VQNGKLRLADRVALVTGGSRGIGRAVVALLASCGAHVVVNYVKGEDAATATVNMAQADGVKAIAIQADVSQLDEAERLLQQTLEHFGRIDFLICNAGIWEGGPVESLSEELWDKTLDINLKGTWSVCRAAVPLMKKQKFAQISFTKSLAPELAGFGVNVNCVAPGWVETEMTSEALADSAKHESIVKSIPLGRVATPEEIAGPIVFLCSEWADHITGEVLNVNGGSVLCG